MRNIASLSEYLQCLFDVRNNSCLYRSGLHGTKALWPKLLDRHEGQSLHSSEHDILEYFAPRTKFWCLFLLPQEKPIVAGVFLTSWCRAKPNISGDKAFQAARVSAHSWFLHTLLGMRTGSSGSFSSVPQTILPILARLMGELITDIGCWALSVHKV